MRWLPTTSKQADASKGASNRLTWDRQARCAANTARSKGSAGPNRISVRQRAGSQYGGSLQTRGGGQAIPWSNYGAYGGGPFSVMRRISDEMDRLFEGFGFGRGALGGGDPGWPGTLTSGAEQGAALWSPHLEMFERDGKLIVTADLPGVKKEDVKVEVDQDAITLQGQRRHEQSSRQQGYYRSERSYGSFYRTIPLARGRGPVDGERDLPRRRPGDRAAGTAEASRAAVAGNQGRAERRGERARAAANHRKSRADNSSAKPAHPGVFVLQEIQTNADSPAGRRWAEWKPCRDNKPKRRGRIRIRCDGSTCPYSRAPRRASDRKITTTLIPRARSDGSGAGSRRAGRLARFYFQRPENGRR